MNNDQPKASACRCPYCDAPVKAEAPFCEPCKVELRFCEQCGKAIPRDAEHCPACGQAQPHR